ncbi:MAG: glycosyltransferase family 2 protein [Phycisphaerales bacterium]|jgi:dolichol-phosphate mannosyltransferase|nr:glycosyltransferase family 2 protein [Phycisphaerales bacterium]
MVQYASQAAEHDDSGCCSGSPKARVLIAIPVYNEEKHIGSVIPRVLERSPDVLVIDDGSTDLTPQMLARFPVEVVRHAKNRGYGRSMQDAFRWARVDGFDWVITMDCDEQHEPDAIPAFMDAIARNDADVISGSRYLAQGPLDDQPPADRRAINAAITDEINRTLDLSLTDGFCGFKAYRVDAVSRLALDEDGYAFPLQFWAQAARRGLRIREIPVRLIYNDLNRTFGGPLNDPQVRINHYRDVFHAELARVGIAPHAPASEAPSGCACH